MTGPEHYREAERLAAEADMWMDADYGWKGNLSSGERMAFRMADLATAQVHAVLAAAAAAALNDAHAGMPLDDHHAWRMAASSEFDTTLPAVTP